MNRRMQDLRASYDVPEYVPELHIHKMIIYSRQAPKKATWTFPSTDLDPSGGDASVRVCSVEAMDASTETVWLSFAAVAG